ncbi:hypothetical protein EG328_010470 [Venturia inaequalis]|uniref:Major facilitator superfamily (MFS) profile domain-containing protein n=1 Tax=Venturia inaequalis TaxID=5025 RepID=A0A8H3V982_VENIN|nr:hypothetical protein EG328_010470 [Venturia inaequalis]
MESSSPNTLQRKTELLFSIHVERIKRIIGSPWTRTSSIYEEDQEKGHNFPASTENADPSTTPDPPHTFHQAALIVCGFVNNALLSGMNNAWPVMMLYHLDHAGDPKLSLLPKEDATNRAKLAWIGSTSGSATAYFITLAIVAVLCRSKATTVLGRVWPSFSSVSHMSAIGAFLIFVGHIAASFSNQYWHLLLTQGILTGIGHALLYNPVTTIANEYFSSKSVGVCTGIMAAGAGVGGVAFAPLTEVLLEKCGMRVTLRILGTIIGSVGLMSAVLSPPPRPMPKRSLFPKKALKNVVFWSVLLAEIAANLTAFIPNTYAPEFSKEVLGFDVKKAATLSLYILNGVGIFGRIGLGFIRDRFGSQNTLILSSVVLAISTALWHSSSNTQDPDTWYAFLVIWGMFLSGFGTIVNAYVSDVFPGEEMFAILGQVNMARGIGSVAGPPLAGKMLGDGSDYKQTIGYLGVMLAVTVTVLCFSRGWIAKTKPEGWKWIA